MNPEFPTPVAEWPRQYAEGAGVGKCSSCGARIVWGVTANDKRMPVDEAPVATGNLLLLMEQDTTIRIDVLTGPRLELARRRGQRLRVSHFATCPDATSHRHTDAA